jgi:hypothetical protein
MAPGARRSPLRLPPASAPALPQQLPRAAGRPQSAGRAGPPATCRRRPPPGAGMARRASNSTRYDHRQRKMLWRVEWSFPAAGASAADQRAPEDALVSELLAAHVAYAPGRAAERFALQRYADAGPGALRVFLRQERRRVGLARRGCALPAAGCRLRPALLRGCTWPSARPDGGGGPAVPRRPPLAPSPAPAPPPQADDPRWHPIDTSATLGSALAGKLVLEYPTLVVALPEEVGGVGVGPVLAALLVALVLLVAGPQAGGGGSAAAAA